MNINTRMDESISKKELKSMLHNQIDNIEQLERLNHQLIDYIHTEQIKAFTDIFEKIQEKLVLIKDTDTNIAEYINTHFPKNTGIFNSDILSLFKTLKAKVINNQKVLEILQQMSLAFIKSYAHSLKQTRTGTKMIQSFKFLNDGHSSIEFNV